MQGTRQFEARFAHGPLLDTADRAWSLVQQSVRTETLIFERCRSPWLGQNSDICSGTPGRAPNHKA